MHSESARRRAAASSLLIVSPGLTEWQACRSALSISGGTPSRFVAGSHGPSCLAREDASTQSTSTDESMAASAAAGEAAGGGVDAGTGSTTGSVAGKGVITGARAAAAAADAGVGVRVSGFAAGLRRLNLKGPSASGPDASRFFDGIGIGALASRAKATDLRRVVGI